MASGFHGSGGPEFYGGGRSVRGGAGTAMNAGKSNLTPSELPYRANLPDVFLDQIGNRTGSILGLAGKRTLADFQAAQQFQNSAALNAILLRSVRPRTFQNLSSTISPFDLSIHNHNKLSNDLSLLGGGGSSPRNGLPIFQQARTQFGLSPGSGLRFGSGNPSLSGVRYTNPVQNQVQPNQVSEKMMSRLKELEKQLLDDDENGEEGDTLSVITNNNSEWSETIQNLVSPNLAPNQNQTPNLVSPSPASSSSSSSSSSAASPVSLCSRQAIMEIATAVSEGKTDLATEILARVSVTTNPNGNSEQKLLELMLHALRSRANPVENPAPVLELYGKDHLRSTQLLHELSPCFKLGFVAANLAILEATVDPTHESGFHVVDFDIGHGGQYLNLVHALAARKFRSTVKITAVADSGVEERLKGVGESLSQLAGRLGVCLVFNVVTGLRLANLSRDSLGCDPDEPLAVNLAFKLFRVPDESVCIENPRDGLLRGVKGLAPRVVTLVEQEMNANTAPLVVRVSEACAYYGTLLDSVESTVPKGNSDRVRVEEGLSRKIVNSVASEGVDRTERCEVFGKWRIRMSMAGFELMPLSQRIAALIRSRLSNGNRVHPGFTVKEDNGGVCFGWMGRTLTVASAWR